MKYCPSCKTDSIAGDNVCLNCRSEWKFVTKYYLNFKGATFIVGIVIAISYILITAYLWL